ncbi:MAG: class I SAM-dependent methyltransferase [bacterium]
MAAPGERDYVLGTSDDEVWRLGFQHRVWGAEAFEIWRRAGFAPGDVVLDVGCGPGYGTIDLAHVVSPNGRVIAIDESRKFLDILRERLTPFDASMIDLRHGDIQRLDIPAASVQGAYTRWVLCFVPDPEAVIAGVARALAPGAAFAIQDYFNYTSLTLAPRGPALARVVDAVEKSWRARGGDCDIMSRIPAYCLKHGLEIEEIRTHVRVARPGTLLWKWPEVFFHGFAPALVAGEFITAQDEADYRAEWDARTADPGSFFMTPPVVDLIARKPAKR